MTENTSFNDYAMLCWYVTGNKAVTPDRDYAQAIPFQPTFTTSPSNSAS
jgi:hypothetical protein